MIKPAKLNIFILLCTSIYCSFLSADTSDGMIRLKSSHDVTGTIDKLEIILRDKGMTIFKRIDHTAGAKKAGMSLRPTELIIFGNPKVGTPLMKCSQTAALDLPQKAVAYEDESGQVWLTYNDPVYLARRHHTDGCSKVIEKTGKALAAFAHAATQP